MMQDDDKNSVSQSKSRARSPPKSLADVDLIYVEATVFQVAHLHKQFPAKYRLELQDSVVKRMKKSIKDYQDQKKKPKATPMKGYLSAN